MEPLHRAWAEIDLDNLRSNFNKIKTAVGDGCKVMCVVKADAYGHGAAQIARRLEQFGCDWFAVSNVEEAVQLRRCGISLPILILGATPAEHAATLAENRITQAVYSEEYAHALSQSAASAGVRVDTHLKLDTGMRRIGFNCSDSAQIEAASEVCRLEGLNVKGVFTHFASADMDGDSDGSFTRAQYERFCGAVSAIESTGVRFEIKHCCNSAAILKYPEMKLDMVRAGIILYGLSPSSEVVDAELKPVMSLRASVSMVKRVLPGEAISYGRTYTAPCEMTVATVPIGYADGYIRAFGKGYSLVGGKRAKIVGRICMDQLMIDVTGMNVSAGDTVTLLGTDGDEAITADELAKYAGTINYETVCLISKRVTRLYLSGGKTVEMTNLLNTGGLNRHEG